MHGNKIFTERSSQRDQVVVKSGEDIIRVVEDTSLEKSKLVNALVIAPVHLSELLYLLALSPVMKGENSQTVSCWFDQAVQLAVDNNLPIIGIGADGDSKVRKFYMNRELGWWKSDVFVRDKQNVDAAKQRLQPAVRDCLIKSNFDSTRGLRANLSVDSCLLRHYTNNEIRVRKRAKLAWTPVVFLWLWKIWILSKQYDSKTHFISDQTYTDTILAGHLLILKMLIFSKYYPDVPSWPSFFGSDACEVLFSYLRRFTSGKKQLQVS